MYIKLQNRVLKGNYKLKNIHISHLACEWAKLEWPSWKKFG